MDSSKLVPLRNPSLPAVTVTAVAAQKIRDALKEEGPDYVGVRLAIVGGQGCCKTERHAIDLETTRRTDDLVVETGGVKIFVGARDAGPLAGAILDFVETPEGSGFRVVSDERNHQCGCDH